MRMKIRYSLTFKEYIQSIIWGFRQTARRDHLKFMGIFGFLLLLTALFHVYHAYREPYYLPVDFFKDAILFSVGLILCLLLWPVIGLRHKLELRPEGIVLMQHFVTIQMPWNVVKVMDEDARFIHMTFLDKHFKIKGASSVGLFIPKRAFASIDEAEKFYNLAQLYCKEAGGQPTASKNALTPPLAN